MHEDGGRTHNLIVVGGGPGGTALGTFVAMQGHRVLILEREGFPRYQIGESLLPSTIHGICRLLGVSEEIAQAGFMRKHGGSYRWGQNEEQWSIAFADIPLFTDTGYAYQVERARFDAILLDNARRRGVEVRERCAVSDVVREGERVTGVRYTDEAGRERVARARYVADAAGNQSRLHVHAGERVYSKFFRNIALFGYFENGKRLPPPRNGNILIAAFREGWFWYIPLSDTLTSVGAVVALEHADKLRQGHEEAMRGFIDSCPVIRDNLSSATRVKDGIYSPLRVRKDWSYCNTRFTSPGLVLIGDAACFVDPVLSTGVHLATYSALLAARSINTCLAGAMDEGPAFAEFERRYLREYRLVYDYLLAFYDMNGDEQSYFWNARKVLNSEEQANEAFIRLVGGGASAADFFREREGLGQAFQRTAVAEMDAPLECDPVALAAAPSFDLSRLGLDGRFLEERRLMAVAREGTAPEAPLFADGLVPSEDGMRWRRLEQGKGFQSALQGLGAAQTGEAPARDKESAAGLGPERVPRFASQILFVRCEGGDPGWADPGGHYILRDRLLLYVIEADLRAWISFLLLVDGQRSIGEILAQAQVSEDAVREQLEQAVALRVLELSCA